MKKLTFKKYERLSSKIEIDLLFSEGTSFYNDGITIRWLFADYEDKTPAKILISVPKRKFKHAVDRNKIKRQIRESYRKNKYILYDTLTKHNKKIIFAVIYGKNKILETKILEEKLIDLLSKLNDLIEQKNKNTESND